MGYLVTIDLWLLSPPRVQPVPFLLLSSRPPLWYFWYLLLFCFTPCGPSFPAPGVCSVVFVFVLSLLTIWCLLLCLHHLSPFLPHPLHCFHFAHTLGLLLITNLFSNLCSSSLSFPLCLSFSLNRRPSLFSVLFPSTPLFPLSSHFHATHWAATLSIFISVCGRGGSPVPATNGLSENTDSHASQSGELHREKEKEDLKWSQRESDFGQRRKQTYEGRSDSEGKKIKVLGSSQAIHGKEIGGGKILMLVETIISNGFG